MQLKSYTDIEQSKKLAEFLPLESADMIYTPIMDIDSMSNSGFLDIPECYSFNEFKNSSIKPLPCWSLAALLNVLELPTLEKCNIGKDKTGWMITVYHNNSRYDSFFYNEPVDACYEVILKLNELKML